MDFENCGGKSVTSGHCGIITDTREKEVSIPWTLIKTTSAETGCQCSFERFAKDSSGDAKDKADVPGYKVNLFLILQHRVVQPHASCS